MKRIYLICFVSLFLLSCTGTKKMTKKAIAFEQQGMYSEASAYYLSALERKSTNIDAAMGLKRTGQLVMDDYLADFFKSHTAKESKASVYSYLKAKDWQKKAGMYKVSLEIPDYYTTYYNEDLSVYLSQLYDEALSYLDKEEFDLGAAKLNEILGFKTDYKDVAELKSYARLEPLYRKGNKALQIKKFRKAYGLFGRTISYKDSEELRAHALKEAQYPIAMLPFENATKVINAHRAFESQFLNLFIKNKNPFIKIIDRVHIQTILAEQELGISGLVDAQTAAQAGDLFGAKALLVGRLVSLDVKKALIKPSRKKGWESYQQKQYNASTKKYDLVTKYKKVHYNEFFGTNSVNMTVEYKLISTETGEILATNLISETREDEVWYITYDANSKNLLSGTWNNKLLSSDTDVINKSYQDRKQIQNLLKANRKLISIEELKNTALKIVSGNAVNEINAYNPEED